MARQPLAGMLATDDQLSGIVEAVEIYIGGKARDRSHGLFPLFPAFSLADHAFPLAVDPSGDYLTGRCSPVFSSPEGRLPRRFVRHSLVTPQRQGPAGAIAHR